jgi:hypothetical protein
MKRLVLGIAMFTALLIPTLTLQSALAVDPLAGPCNDPNAVHRPEICNDNQTNTKTSPLVGPGGILTVVINILSLLVGIISVIIIIVEGMRLALASGDANTASTARRGVIYACVGVVVALISQGVVALVLNKL